MKQRKQKGEQLALGRRIRWPRSYGTRPCVSTSSSSTRMKRPVSSQLLVHPGAQQHYESGRSYERRYAGRTEDRDFYVRRVRAGESVLEYGAGTGRFSLPLVEKGAQVLAVDLSSSMLEVLQERAQELPAAQRRHLQIQQGDMRTFSTRRRFDWVLAGFHTFCHLYTKQDVALFLSKARTHLKPGGRLLFDVPVPRIDAAGYDACSQVCVMEMEGDHGVELLTQRWFQPQELRMHLSYAGFEKIKLYGDFTHQAPDQETDFLVLQAQNPVK